MVRLGVLSIHVLAIACFLRSAESHSDHVHQDTNPQTTSGEPVNELRPTKEHILEELQHQINTKDKKDFTDEEMNFYYFKLHDLDKNNELDGLEIVKAIKHQHDEHNDDEKHKSPEFSEEELIRAVDSVLGMDLDGNGFISFAEFKAMQGK